jgi:hypothetical protein
MKTFVENSEALSALSVYLWRVAKGVSTKGDVELRVRVNDVTEAWSVDFLDEKGEVIAKINHGTLYSYGMEEDVPVALARAMSDDPLECYDDHEGYIVSDLYTRVDLLQDDLTD